MATKQFQKLQEFNDAELVSELEQTRAQYQKLTFDHAIKGLDNPIALRDIRRDIARLQSEIRRREVEKMSDKDLAQRSKIRERRRRKK